MFIAFFSHTLRCQPLRKDSTDWPFMRLVVVNYFLGTTCIVMYASCLNHISSSVTRGICINDVIPSPLSCLFIVFFCHDAQASALFINTISLSISRRLKHCWLFISNTSLNSSLCGTEEAFEANEISQTILKTRDIKTSTAIPRPFVPARPGESIASLYKLIYLSTQPPYYHGLTLCTVGCFKLHLYHLIDSWDH